MPAPVSRAAPAKVNLALHVTGRRPDGYHSIETLAVFTGFGDRVRTEAAGSDSFAVSGPFAAAIPHDGENLVLAARDLLRSNFPRRCGPVAVALEKNLPAASGVGGGSSDAAATLKALAQLWALPLSAAELARLGLPLGADLPMCLAARPLIARGIGEEIEALETLPALPMALVNPGVAVATPRIFAALARRDNPPLPALPARMGRRELLDWLAATRNDLEAPALALAPEIAEVLAGLREEGALFARMSGSGATCYGLFETEDAAARAVMNISARRPGWFATATKSEGAE